MVPKIVKNIYSPTYKLLLSFMVIKYVYSSFIPNKTVFTKYCLTQIHWVRKYPVNFTSLVGITNATVNKTEPIFTGLEHGKWLRQDPPFVRVLTASFALSPWVLHKQRPRSPGHYPLNNSLNAWFH